MDRGGVGDKACALEAESVGVKEFSIRGSEAVACAYSANEGTTGAESNAVESGLVFRKVKEDKQEGLPAVCKFVTNVSGAATMMGRDSGEKWCKLGKVRGKFVASKMRRLCHMAPSSTPSPVWG